MGPEEFRAAGHELIDWIADYRARIPQLPVQAQVKPGEVAGKLPVLPPAQAEPFGQVLADLERVVVPGVTQVQHPRYFGWFPANASLASVLGDLAAGGLGALGITWQSAPALTEVEEVVVGWLRELTALPATWRGVIQDTASTACLVALLAARERATDYSEVRGGRAPSGRVVTRAGRLTRSRRMDLRVAVPFVAMDMAAGEGRGSGVDRFVRTVHIVRDTRAINQPFQSLMT